MTPQAPQMFGRTGSDDFPTHLKLLLSGPPKSGKTTFLGTVPDIIIADTEPHANNLQSVAHLNLPYQSIRSSDDLRALHTVLRDDTLRNQAADSLGMDQIGAVAIDTLDTLQSIMKKERVAQTRKDFLRDDWGWIKEEMVSLLQAFTSLPMHVIFVVHTKTKEIGLGDSARTVVLPGLEGSIDQMIAGMVGYSLLSFRKQELRPDGSAYTKYWLRAEGDENHDFVGNRAAGQLPDIIEPDFKTLLNTVKNAKEFAQKNSAPVRPTVEIQRTDTAAPPVSVDPTPSQLRLQPGDAPDHAGPAPEQPPAPAPAPAPEPVAQTSGQPSEPAAPAPEQALAQHQPVPGTAGVQASAPAAPPTPPNDNDQPANAAALMHVKKVYDALEMKFPEQVIKNMSMGECRKLVQMWLATQQDHTLGKGTPGYTPALEMREYLLNTDLLCDPDAEKVSAELAQLGQPAEQVPPPAPAPVPQQPTEKSTADQVLAWVENDPEKATWAWAQEQTRESPRVSLLGALERRGARPTPQSTPQSTPQVTAQEQTPVQNEEVTTAQAVQNVTEGLGGSVLAGDTGEAERPCQVCGQPVDDLDIARLSSGRFNAWLCVKDYVARTKQPVAAG